MSAMNSMFNKAVDQIISFISDARNERFINSLYNDELLGDSFGDIIATIFEFKGNLESGKSIEDVISNNGNKKHLGSVINLILKVIKGGELKTAILESIRASAQQPIDLREISISALMESLPDNDYTPEELLSLFYKTSFTSEEEEEETAQDAQSDNEDKTDFDINEAILCNKKQYLELFYPYFELYHDKYIDLDSLIYVCVHTQFFFMNRSEHIDRYLWPKVIRELSEAIAKKIKYLYYKNVKKCLAMGEAEDEAYRMAFYVIKQTLSENNSYNRTEYRSNWANIRVVAASVCRKYMNDPDAYIKVNHSLSGKSRRDYKQDSRMREFIQEVYEEFKATNRNDCKV
jgi:hypothetical protein